MKTTTHAADLLHAGLTIPAHPLALHEDRTFDERRQRALTRYYLAAGAGGLAVGVHTTQFSIRHPDVALYEPVLRAASEVVTAEDAEGRVLMVAGVSGPLTQAVAEATTAASLGYDAILLAPNDTAAMSEDDLLARTRAVGDVLPVIGFYLQPAVGGRILGRDYWRRLADIDAVIGVKLAPFDRYRTIEAISGIEASGRARRIALYTGNDDSIVADLLTDFPSSDTSASRRFVGGLLGQWAVGTRSAVDLMGRIARARGGELQLYPELMRDAAALTDINSAVFDAANAFAGSIAGVNEVLYRQGLLAGSWCLEPHEVLSHGQSAALDRVLAAYPSLTDTEFVQENVDRWLDG